MDGSRFSKPQFVGIAANPSSNVFPSIKPSFGVENLEKPKKEFPFQKLSDSELQEKKKIGGCILGVMKSSLRGIVARRN